MIEEQTEFYESLSEADRLKFFGIPSSQKSQTIKYDNTNSFFVNEKDSTALEKKSRVKGFMKHFLISHDSKWKEIFDFVVLIMNFLTCIIVIYNISIQKGIYLSFYVYIFEIFFLIYIILNFFHEYQDPETLENICSYKEIAYKYIFQGWFLIDIASVIPYELFLGKQYYFFKLLRFLRMTKLVKVIEHSIFEKIIVSFFCSNKDGQIGVLHNIRFIYKILRLITIAIMMTYFIGCIWYLFCDNMSKYFSNESFISVYDLDSKSELERIIVSCYFILTTLTTVGYGDYVASNNAERILAIFIMLLGVGMFSYVMGNLNELISSYDKTTGVKDKTSDLHDWLSLLKRFTKKPFSSALIKKVDKHFLYFWENDRNSSITKNDPYLISLPKSMRIKVMEFLWGDILTKFSHFFLYYPGNREKFFKFYYDISFLFQPRFFNYRDIIYKTDEECEEMYFILEGDVELGYLQAKNNDSKDRLRYSKDTQSFEWIGDFYCLFNVKSRYYYRASSEIKAYAINKFDLLKAIEGCEELYNKLRSRSYRRYNDYIKNILEKKREGDNTNISNNLNVNASYSNVENFPNETADAKKLNTLFISTYRKHKNEVKILNSDAERKCVKLDDDFMNMSRKFYDVSAQIDKEIFNLNSELEEIHHKLEKHEGDLSVVG